MPLHGDEIVTMCVRLQQLHRDLAKLVIDSEQEVTGIAAPVVAATIEEAANGLPDGPLPQACRDVVPRLIELNESLRVAEALPVVGQLLSAFEMLRDT